MYYLGLDLSWSGTGIVLVNENDVVFSKCKTTSSKEEKWDRVERIWQEIYEAAWKVLTCPIPCVEGYSFGSNFSRESMGELGGIIRYKLYHCQFVSPYIEAPPKTLKKFATGTGNASKSDMLKAARLDGFKTSNHNIADAYFLAKYAKHVTEKSCNSK